MEEVFNKNLETAKPKKPKRKLTEKQLEALKRGREKRALKLKEKQDKLAEKQMVKDEKFNRQQKKALIKEQEKVSKVLDHRASKEEEEEKRKNAEFLLFKSNFNKMKYETLDKIDDKDTYRTMRKYLNTINVKDYSSIEEIKSKMMGDITKLNTFQNKK